MQWLISPSPWAHTNLHPFTPSPPHPLSPGDVTYTIIYELAYGFRVIGSGSWVYGWVGGPPKGLQSAAVTLVTSSWRVKLEAFKRLTKEVQS